MAVDPGEGAQLVQRALLALSSDESSSRSVIMELRPGVGGEEASLFAGELLEMYTRFAKKKGWDVQLMDVARSDLGGLKNGTISIEGEDVYKYLKFETGAHRAPSLCARTAQMPGAWIAPSTRSTGTHDSHSHRPDDQRRSAHR